MSDISITLLPEEPVIKTKFQDYLIGKEVQIFDYKLADFDPDSGSTPDSLGTKTIAAADFPTNPDDVYLPLVFPITTGQTSADLLVKLIDPAFPNEPLLEEILNYQFIIETNNFSANKEPSKYTNGYILVPVGAGGYASLFKKDGTPPPYEDLETALDTVMTESGNNTTVLKDLNYLQCLHLAREIVWRYLPVKVTRPEGKIKKLYDFEEDATTGEITEKSGRHEKRVRFESELKKHYNDGEMEAQRLATFIFAFSCAQWVEDVSSGIEDILFRFPVQLPNLGSKEINISGLSSGLVTIPAKYAYVHGVNIPVDIVREKRFEQIKTEEQDLLLKTFQTAKEKRTAKLSTTGKSPEQIVRLLRSLDAERPSLPAIDLTAGTYGNPDLKVEELITSWSNYTGESSLDFWSGTPTPLTANDLEGHSELVMFLFSQGNVEFFDYLDGRFENIEVAVGTNSLLDIDDGNDGNTKDEWKQLYQDYLDDGSTITGDEGITFLPPGTILERKDYFAIYACDFFGNLAVVSNDYSLDITLHPPPVFSEEKGPIQKFFGELLTLPGSISDLYDPNKTEPIIAACFPDDACRQEWLRDKVTIFSNLYQVTDGIVDDCLTDEIRLTVWESLYALGITEKSQIQSMDLNDFRNCVKGTILDGPRDFTIEVVDPLTQEISSIDISCDIGELIHGNVTVTIPPPGSNFIPINPGSLVNCIPPDHLSKTGHFAYLQDLLAFNIGDKTVSELLVETRGMSFDDLLVSKENAEIKIPRIDVMIGLLEGTLCNQDAVVGNWDAHHFIDLLTAFKGLTIASKEQFFLELDILPPSLNLSTTIQAFGNSTCNLSGVQSHMAGLCQELNMAFANGDFINFNDLTTILNNQSPTNLFAPILLDFINAMIDMDDVQFNQESAEIAATMATLPNNPVIKFLTFLIESINQPTPQSIGVGNSGFQAYEVLIPPGKENDSAYLEEIAQSIPPLASLTDATCAYEKLAISTKAPCKLPYHQPLTVSKAYLSTLGTTRFELAQKFSQHIHGFPYEPDNAPGDYKTHLFRLPINHGLALEYLCISPQEYALFYKNTPFPTGGDPIFHKLLGYDSVDDLLDYPILSEFLERNCLECCDLECWLNSGFEPLQIRDLNEEKIALSCQDCELFNHHIGVVEDPAAPEELKLARLWHLTMLIRLARQLKKAGIQCYSCSDLVLISDQLNWISYDTIGQNTTISPHFLEQFVALDQLRSVCGICFNVPSDVDNPAYLSDLLAGPSGANWGTVLAYFIEKIVEKCNAGKAPESCRNSQFIKLAVEHVDVLAILSGFRSDSDDYYQWYYQFTNIIRFAQVLSRICDSVFSVGQLHYIFTADAQLVGDDPYPQQTRNEAQKYPFNLPDNSAFDLEALREKLLNIELDQVEIESWTWSKMVAHLSADFGYTGTSFLEMGKRFFPQTLETLGYPITNADLQFQEALADANTAQLMWNTGDVNPFFYIPGTPGPPVTLGFLTCKIPLKSADVIQKLQTIRQLNTEEEIAVQNLFFAPRLMLTPFAPFFENFTDALSVLIETEDEPSRWKYFQKNFALFFEKCKTITKHFTEHIANELGMTDLDERVTWKILAHLYADDNQATALWEDIDGLGISPSMTYSDKIHAGAFAALTKLSGTGVKGTFKDSDGKIIWREIRGGLTAYGWSENLNDHPSPTVIPNINFAPQNVPLIGIVRNGNVLTNGSPSKLLGGAQGHTAEYKGELYITKTGKHTFRAGAPTDFSEIPDFDQAKHSQWQLTLQRGSKTWVILDNDWDAPDTPGDCSVEMNLKRGAYQLCFTFKQPEPSLQNMKDGCPQPTGWQIKWTTPYQQEWHTIPISHLYHKEPFGDLSEDVQLLHATATTYLKNQYQPSISGIRRTAIRLFAGGLLLHGSKVSATPISDSESSEIDYLLNNPALFEGFSHFKDGGVWKTHLAGFYLNFIPVLDNYCPPDYADDQRIAPSVPRIQALFQWFEQLWEINNLKNEAATQGLDSVWLLWHELIEDHNPADLEGHLNQYLGVGFDKTHLVMHFHSGFNLSGSDLLNEEWTIRVWEILKCIEAWKCKFSPTSFKEAKPSEWVDIDFNSKGNENLVSFVTQGFTRSQPSQFEKLRTINDHIRKESRLALTCYFESLTSDPSLILNDLLLMDSAIGVCDTASRLDIARGMVQTFLTRINLGIENLNNTGSISFSNKEEQVWSSQYASFKAWKTCKQRDCYPENFIIHNILKEDSKSPGFRLLKEELKKDVLTMPVSGGITKLQAKQPPSLSSLMPLQESVPSHISASPPIIGRPVVSGVKNWESSDTTDQVNFWTETAENLNIPYLRVAAASLPLAGIQYGCKDASCCNSCEEAPFYPVTEYYFGLIQSKYYEEIQQTYQDWENGNNIEELLYMKDKLVSFLAWSKIENGKAGAVQWSPIGIKTEEDPIELIFKGRFKDSLWIEAKNGITALEELLDSDDNPITGTGIAPGFRFDLATEEVVILPEIGEQLPDPFDIESDPFYFLYHNLGAPRYPKTLDGTVYLISKQLQSNCDFKGAKTWLDNVLNTLNRDNHWDNTSDLTASMRKALLMTYMENLLTWAKHLHEKNTEESISQAKMVLGLAGKILGERPKEISTVQPDPASLTNFSPLHPQINPKLLCLYDEYHSLAEFLEYCLNHQGKNCHSISESLLPPACYAQVCCHPIKDCVPASPYRFLSLINRAKEYANALSTLGNSLQSAIEKGDQERLTSLREVQSNQLIHLNLETKQILVREAHFQVKALEKTLEITKIRLVHNQNLLNVGLIAQEQDYISLTKQSMVAQAASQGLNAVAQFIMLLPELFPPLASDVGGGTKTAHSLQGGAAVAGVIGGILQTRALLKNNDGGNFRREQEWMHQRNVLVIEVEQIKNQLVAANLRLLNAQKDLNNYQIQIEHSNQTLKYLRDKFTNQEFYQWQEKELSQLHYEVYKCSMQVAFQAEKAFNVERCYSNEQFLNFPMWNNAYRGLLAGEHLTAALRNMEKRFMDTDHKMYELSKSISLFTEMPRTFLVIKYNGTGLIKVSEDLFAFDHPSHYCRVYKSISITIPCVVGPYVNVNASMTLRNSFVRVNPKILPTDCGNKKYADGYRMREDDDRFVFIASGKDTLATSRALQDSGYYQLSFQNPQYLTYENAGVKADFCFTLKQANNRFDIGTVSDIILETSYLAKEGGELYGKAAAEAVKHRLPGNGELLIKIPDNFPDSWYQMQAGAENQYRLELGRQDFPFLSFDADLFICQMELIIETPPCGDCDVIEVIYQDEDHDHCKAVTIFCQRSSVLGNKAFHGVLISEFPVSNSNERAFLGNLCFPQNMEIKNLYLLISYKALPTDCRSEDQNCC